MTVPINDAKQVAVLARLHLSDQQAIKVAADLSSILDHIAVLTKLDGPVVAAEGAAPLAADVVGSDVLSRSLAQFAPDFRDGLILVPRLAAHREGSEG